LFAENQQQREQLVEEYEAAKECGIHALLTTDVPLPCHSEAAIRLEQQGRFHVMKYLQGLADHVHGGNGAIYEHTRVLEPPEGGSPCMVSTDRGVIRASDVILATHSPFLGVSVMDARVAPYQSYVLTVELEEPIADALYWDLDSPYHYLRQASSSEPNVWIIGGADHKTGQADERQCYAALEQYARGRFRVRKVRQRWSAELFESSDGAPFIGQVPLQKHLYLATGFSGTGLTWGTVAGRLLASQILDQPHPLSETLAPSRLKPLAAAGDLVKENMNVVKRFVTDRYKAETAEELHEAELEPGEGRVLKHDGELIAVCKDAAGDLHACTATCTHAGCAVQWNRAEQTWDCPCHGGRYDSLGRRIYGPPPSDLKIRNVQEIIRSSSTTS
jgi:Rieske Fe-S protein